MQPNDPAKKLDCETHGLHYLFKIPEINIHKEEAKREPCEGGSIFFEGFCYKPQSLLLTFDSSQDKNLKRNPISTQQLTYCLGKRVVKKERFGFRKFEVSISLLHKNVFLTSHFASSLSKRH